MKKHLWTGVLLGVLCGGVGGVPREARAGHYELASVEWADEATLAALASAGIETTEDLWKATRTGKGLGRLARKTRIPVPRLREWHRLCDLMFIGGVGPRVARVLTESGVRDRKELARQDPEALTRIIEETNRRIGVLGKLPDVDSVRSWIEQARQQSAPPGSRGSR
ncbi:DUF4332 domain-containing protein [Myxococcota bacterium]|jgi:predicted flap endonuclease-1-like 5' DNA nuclease|nr:DUF4332 domain-containing protein [Myxococcota bacterium]